MTVERIEGEAIQALLPHRYPFLLVDRIDVIERGLHVVGTKRLAAGEWWCTGARAPSIFPFGLVIEALAQTSGAIVRDLTDGAEGAVAYFMGANRVRLRTPARVGEELTMTVVLRQWRRGLCRAYGEATVRGHLVAAATLTTMVRGVV
jgi:3-hydroxyacyl-[acyl-carrier-protein] dehydratase